MRRVHFCVGAIVLLTSLVTLTGCGRRFPKTYPVKGKLVVKGGKLVKGSSILFQSESLKQDDGSAVTADGVIEADGTFTVTTRMFGKSKPGAVEGEHTVMISEPDTAGPDGQFAFMPIIVQQKAKIEPRDNELNIQAVKPVRKSVRP